MMTLFQRHICGYLVSGWANGPGLCTAAGPAQTCRASGPLQTLTSLHHEARTHEISQFPSYLLTSAYQSYSHKHLTAPILRVPSKFRIKTVFYLVFWTQFVYLPGLAMPHPSPSSLDLATSCPAALASFCGPAVTKAVALTCSGVVSTSPGEQGPRSSSTN